MGAPVIPIGPHRAWIELPDIFATEWHGEVTPDHMRAMYDEVERFAATCPHIMALNIVGDAPTLGRAARQVAANDSRTKLLRDMAIVGAGFHIRVVATMLVKASRLIGQSQSMRVEFFSTPDDGRTWLAKLRQERQTHSAS